MKIYSIRDKTVGDYDLAYFYMNERTGDCCIELCDGVDEWDLPFILDYYAKKGEKSIDMQHTMEFIRQRIIPPDRQNIGSVLKDNGLEEYDEIKLFVLADGRCAQDECYIRRIMMKDLPDYIIERMGHYIETVVVTENGDYLIGFRNNEIAILSKEDENLLKERCYARMIAYVDKLGINVSGMGNYLSIGGHDCISGEYAYKHGRKLTAKMSDLQKLALQSIMSTQDVCETLGCSRQNVNDLVRRGKLTPIEANNRNMIFSKSEVMKRI